MTTQVLDRVPIETLERHLTEERMRPYRLAAGSSAGAARLYQWNLLASGATYEILAIVEVVLRNALDGRLQHTHAQRGLPGDWWDDPLKMLDERRREDVRAARARVRRHPTTHGRVLAELSFGFWRYLLSRRYEATLWTPALRHAFPYLRPAGRDRIYRPVDRLHGLRNRIAHHEPVHGADLAGREDDAAFVAGCVHPDLARWLRDTSRLGGVLGLRPGIG